MRVRACVCVRLYMTSHFSSAEDVADSRQPPKAHARVRAQSVKIISLSIEPQTHHRHPHVLNQFLVSMWVGGMRPAQLCVCVCVEGTGGGGCMRLCFGYLMCVPVYRVCICCGCVWIHCIREWSECVFVYRDCGPHFDPEGL